MKRFGARMHTLVHVSIAAACFAAGFGLVIQATALSNHSPDQGVSLLGGLLPGWMIVLFLVTAAAFAVYRRARSSAVLRAQVGGFVLASPLRCARTCLEGALAGVCVLALCNPANVPRPIVLLDLSSDRIANIMPEAGSLYDECVERLRHSATGLDFEFMPSPGETLAVDRAFAASLASMAAKAPRWSSLPVGAQENWKKLLDDRKSPPIAEVLEAYRQKLDVLPYGQVLYVVSIDPPTAERTKNRFPLPVTRSNSCQWFAVRSQRTHVEKPTASSLYFSQSPRQQPTLKFTFDWPRDYGGAPPFVVRFTKNGTPAGLPVNIHAVPPGSPLPDPATTIAEGYSVYATDEHMAFVLEKEWLTRDCDHLEIECTHPSWPNGKWELTVDPHRVIKVHDAANFHGVYPWLVSSLAPGIQFVPEAAESDIVWLANPAAAPGGKPGIVIAAGKPWDSTNLSGSLFAPQETLRPNAAYTRGWCDYPGGSASAPGTGGDTLFRLETETASGLTIHPVAWKTSDRLATVVLPASAPPVNQLHALSYVLRATSSLLVYPDHLHSQTLLLTSRGETEVPQKVGHAAAPGGLYGQLWQCLLGRRDEAEFSIPPTSLRPAYLGVALGILGLFFLVWAVLAMDPLRRFAAR